MGNLPGTGQAGLWVGWLEYPSSLPQQLGLLGLLGNDPGAYALVLASWRRSAKRTPQMRKSDRTRSTTAGCSGVCGHSPAPSLGSRPTYDEISSLPEVLPLWALINAFHQLPTANSKRHKPGFQETFSDFMLAFPQAQQWSTYRGSQ